MPSKWLEKQREREEMERLKTEILATVEAIEVPEEVPAQPNQFKPGTVYTWVKHDNIWDVSRRLGFSPEELIEHNDIQDYNDIKPGDILHLPIARVVVEKPKIRYEVLPEVRDMHVVLKGGAKKWHFGNVRSYNDFTSSGFYPENTNLKIVAVAHVPVDDDKRPEAGFYMDSRALGAYESTGRVQATVGFRWIDLAQGIADPFKRNESQKLVEQKVKIETAFKRAKEATHDKDGFDPQFVQNRIITANREGMAHFMETYQVLNNPIRCMAMLPDGVGEVEPTTGIRYIYIKDYFTKRPDRVLRQHQEVVIGATFEFNGVLVGRPVAAIKAGYFFAIPMDLLQSEAHAYNAKLDTEERVEVGKFTLFEKFFWVPVARLVNDPRLKRNNKNNKESK